MLTRDSVQVVFPFNATPAVYIRGIKRGSLQHYTKSISCSDERPFTSRFVMSDDTGVYYLSTTNCLVYYTWASLSMSKFDSGSILQRGVIDFDLMSDSCDCITERNKLTKDGADIAIIKLVPYRRRLTTVGIVGSHAVCSATMTDDTAVILAYDMNGVFESSVTIQVTNGRKQANDGICWIMPADVTHGHAAFIAVERRRYVHLVAIDSHGRLSVISRVDMTSSEHPLRTGITCISAYDIAGQFTVGGYMWIKKISVKI